MVRISYAGPTWSEVAETCVFLEQQHTVRLSMILTSQKDKNGHSFMYATVMNRGAGKYSDHPIHMEECRYPGNGRSSLPAALFGLLTRWEGGFIRKLEDQRAGRQVPLWGDSELPV